MRIVTEKKLAAVLLQEIFISTWNKINLYDNTRGRLFTWMMNRAHHSAITRLLSGLPANPLFKC